jgi:hypothetical protein
VLTPSARQKAPIPSGLRSPRSINVCHCARLRRARLSVPLATDHGLLPSMWLMTGSIVRASREAGRTPLSCRLQVRYKGLAKNTNQLHVLFALANLYTLRRPLMA